MVLAWLYEHDLHDEYLSYQYPTALTGSHHFGEYK